MLRSFLPFFLVAAFSLPFAALPADDYSLSAFLDGFVEDFDGMAADGTVAPGDVLPYWTVMPGNASALILPDTWPSNNAYNMGFTLDAGDASDRALGVYGGAIGDERWLRTTLFNDTGASYTGPLTIAYDIECWIQRMPDRTAGFTFKIDGVEYDTSYLENVAAVTWSENFWIDGNENALSVSVTVAVDIPPEGIIALEWDGRGQVPTENRKQLGAGIDNLSITGQIQTDPLFKRGDANADDKLDLADSIYILSTLFSDGDPSTCEKTADANDDGKLDLADPIMLLTFLFADGVDLPAPFQVCGTDPQADELTCEFYTPCE